ncbi:hypothetical protein [Candidatus Korobacter versatilis]|nr:hypothetical protein [Candidatus Koribacter versatilis]
MKSAKEYTEGREAAANFNAAMAAAFQAPKTPRPEPKRKVTSRKASGKN